MNMSKKGNLTKNMPNDLSTTRACINRHLPAISDMNDQELQFVVSRALAQERTILENRKAVGIDFNSLSENLTLGNLGLELPDGWGDLLDFLALPLITGIQSGAMTPEMLEITTSPLLLLLRLLLLNSVSEADEAIRPIGFVAQELFDILRLMPRLRNGGPRLLQRMQSCIHALTTWTPD